jgi:hypothetical protein
MRAVEVPTVPPSVQKDRTEQTAIVGFLQSCSEKGDLNQITAQIAEEGESEWTILRLEDNDRMISSLRSLNRFGWVASQISEAVEMFVFI